MKNKFTLLVLAFLTIFSFRNTAYCQSTMDEGCYCDSYAESSYADYDYYDVCDAYRYVSLGVGPVVFIPNVGIGYRQRQCQFGWDTALSFSTIGYAHQLSAHLVGHYYLNPWKQNSAYVGLGLIGSGILINREGGCGTLSPDFVFGKSLENCGCNRHFIEMHVAIPTLCMGCHDVHELYLPLMYIKYGMSF